MTGRWHRRWILGFGVLSFLWWGVDPTVLGAAESEEQSLLQSPIDPDARESAPRRLTVYPSDVRESRRVALGVNYLGIQTRYRFRSPWAVEARWQTGKSSSDFGEVVSNVYSLRGYRYVGQYRAALLYCGSEAGLVRAKADASSYAVKGFAMGAFGGMDIKIARHLYLAMDIGPYVLSLREKQTQVNETSLDFVLSTGVLWYLF